MSARHATAAEKTSSRRFSKRMVVANCALAWGAIYLSIIFLQASYVVASGLGFVALIAGAYMGVGHLDLRQYVKSLGSSALSSSYFPPAPEPPVTKPATPEDQLT